MPATDRIGPQLPLALRAPPDQRLERYLQAPPGLAAQLRAGMVWINTWLQRDLRTPFGGTGASGLGREGGFEAMRFFTDAKNVGLQLD